MWLRLLSYIAGHRHRRLKVRKIFRRKVIPPKILIVRNDGMGDFILTLPIISAIKAEFPHARIHVLAAKSLHAMAAFLPEIDGWVTDPGCLLKRHRKNKSSTQLDTEFTGLVREIAAYRFDLAIFAYAETKSVKLIRAAGIPYRLGPLRRSFFFKFNLWYYIPRQKSGQAEYQLNLKILRSLGLVPQFRFPRVEVPLLSKAAAAGRYIVMHPYKRSGTALTWPIENFQSLARHYSAKKTRVIVIGDQSDYETLLQYFGTIPFVNIRTDLNLVQTAALLKDSRHFFGNSSGPLHLAALVGAAHTGFFPQNKIAAPRRWRTLPLPGAPRMSQHLLATDFPVECVRCRLTRCEFFPCTGAISLETAVNSANFWQKAPARSATKPTRRRPKRK